MDFRTLLNQATDSVCLNPKLDLFEEIGKIFNTTPTSAKEYLPVIKKRLTNRNPRTQFLTLELLEYLTCVSSQQAHNAIHDKNFLQAINSILNRQTTDEVKSKCLFLIQFWAQFFQQDADIFPNFGKMYHRAKQANLPFGNPQESQYARMRKFNQFSGGGNNYGAQQFGTGNNNQWGGNQGNSFGNQGNGFGAPQMNRGPVPSFGGSSSNIQIPFVSDAGLTPELAKVKNDMNVLCENIDKAEYYLRVGNESKETFDLYFTLEKLREKMDRLVINLGSSGNYQMVGMAEAVKSKLLNFLDKLNSVKYGGNSGGGAPQNGGFGAGNGAGFGQNQQQGQGGFGGNAFNNTQNQFSGGNGGNQGSGFGGQNGANGGFGGGNGGSGYVQPHQPAQEAFGNAQNAFDAFNNLGAGNSGGNQGNTNNNTNNGGNGGGSGSFWDNIGGNQQGQQNNQQQQQNNQNEDLLSGFTQNQPTHQNNNSSNGGFNNNNGQNNANNNNNLFGGQQQQQAPNPANNFANFGNTNNSNQNESDMLGINDLQNQAKQTSPVKLVDLSGSGAHNTNPHAPILSQDNNQQNLTNLAAFNQLGGGMNQAALAQKQLLLQQQMMIMQQAQQLQMMQQNIAQQGQAQFGVNAGNGKNITFNKPAETSNLMGPATQIPKEKDPFSEIGEMIMKNN